MIILRKKPGKKNLVEHKTRKTIIELQSDITEIVENTGTQLAMKVKTIAGLKKKTEKQE